MAFAPDGQTLASGSWDNTVRLWNLADLTADPIVLEGHEGLVFSVAFSPDGQMLASGSRDTTIRLWSTFSRLVELGCQAVRRNLPWAEWQRYLGPDEPYNQACPNLPIPADVPAAQR